MKHLAAFAASVAFLGAIGHLAPAVADDDEVPQPSAGQKLALTTKPSVVRVVAGYLVEMRDQGAEQRRFIGGHGSGFFVDPDGYVATNAHVVEFVHISDDKAREQITEQVFANLAQAYKAEVASMTPRQLARFKIELQRAIRIVEKVMVIVLPNGDKLPYDIKAYGAPVSTAGVKDVAILKVQTKNAPTLLIGDDKTVQIQDKILAIGYPGAADDLIGVLDESSMLEATITDGAVSAKKKSADGVPVIQVTTIISPGNSGGPAINEKGEVVGLATFGHAKRQGYNFIVPAVVVKEFVRQAGAENKRSPTNAAYREALELHWKGQYTKAIAKLEEVKQLFPSHSEADRLIDEARELKLAGKEKDDAEETDSAIAIALLVTGLIVGAVFFLARRARRRARGQHPRGAWQRHGHRHGQPTPHGGHHGGHARQHGGHHGAHARQHGGHGARPGHGHPGGAAAASPAGQAGAGFSKTVAIAPSGNARTVAVSSAGQLASLTVSRGPLQGQKFALGPHGITIGRENRVAQIVIADGRVSSKHVWIGFQDGKLMAIDQGSTNGTFINDMQRGRVTSAVLQHGDTVIVSEPDVCSLTVHNPGLVG